MASENNSSKMGAPMTEELVFDPENQQPADARLFNRRRQTGRAERRRGKEGIELEKRLAPPPPPATWRTGGVKLAADVRAATERHWGRMTHGTAYVRSRAPPLSPPLPRRAALESVPESVCGNNPVDRIGIESVGQSTLSRSLGAKGWSVELCSSAVDRPQETVNGRPSPAGSNT